MKALSRKTESVTELLAALQAHRGGILLAPDVSPALWTHALMGPAADFLARPGKALRARALAQGFRLAGKTGEPPDALALAVEALHAGSLIVDDIEDDSAERRGAPALHRLVGTPLAINTGNWLYFWALALLGDAGLPPAVHTRALDATVRTLMACHQGQALDLAVGVGTVPRHDMPGLVAAVTRLKTGALMGLAMRLGALAAGADPAREAAMAELGEAMGIGLQMLDDLGSLASPSRLDKGREDLRAARPTWPWAWLATTSDGRTWERLTQRAAATIDDGAIDALAGELRHEIEPHGRRAVREHLAHVLSRAAALGDASELAAALAHMEASYG